MSIETTLARIVLAGLIGGIIGWISGSRKDVRLFSMICMGASLVTYISAYYYIPLSMSWYADPGRLSAQIIVALGFIGSCLIWISPEKKVEGITTAAALWLTAIVGMAIGAGLNNVNEALIIFISISFLVYKIIVRR
jgi:putative Mg2+ transporter-C (MgtC) family protein